MDADVHLPLASVDLPAEVEHQDDWRRQVSGEEDLGIWRGIDRGLDGERPKLAQATSSTEL